MSLEQNQRLHDGFISNSHNISGSNDPKQIPNDAVDTLLKGANLIASGRSMGLNDEEILQQASQNYRRQAFFNDLNSTNDLLNAAEIENFVQQRSRKLGLS